MDRIAIAPGVGGPFQHDDGPAPRQCRPPCAPASKLRHRPSVAWMPSGSARSRPSCNPQCTRNPPTTARSTSPDRSAFIAWWDGNQRRRAGGINDQRRSATVQPIPYSSGRQRSHRTCEAKGLYPRPHARRTPMASLTRYRYRPPYHSALPDRSLRSAAPRTCVRAAAAAPDRDSRPHPGHSRTARGRTRRYRRGRLFRGTAHCPSMPITARRALLSGRTQSLPSFSRPRNAPMSDAQAKRPAMPMTATGSCAADDVIRRMMRASARRGWAPPDRDE